MMKCLRVCEREWSRSPSLTSSTAGSFQSGVERLSSPHDRSSCSQLRGSLHVILREVKAPKLKRQQPHHGPRCTYPGSCSPPRPPHFQGFGPVGMLLLIPSTVPSFRTLVAPPLLLSKSKRADLCNPGHRPGTVEIRFQARPMRVAVALTVAPSPVLPRGLQLVLVDP